MRRTWMVAIGLAVTTACSGNSATGPGVEGPDDDLATTRVDEAFTLAIGERATVSAADLEVAFLEVVGDSRCPVDVTCVWQGDGLVAIEVVQADREIAVTLHTGVEPMSFAFGDWRVRLTDLAPQPRDGETISRDAYRATFRVTPTGE